MGGNVSKNKTTLDVTAEALSRVVNETISNNSLSFTADQNIYVGPGCQMTGVEITQVGVVDYQKLTSNKTKTALKNNIDNKLAQKLKEVSESFAVKFGDKKINDITTIIKTKINSQIINRSVDNQNIKIIIKQKLVCKGEPGNPAIMTNVILNQRATISAAISKTMLFDSGAENKIKNDYKGVLESEEKNTFAGVVKAAWDGFANAADTILPWGKALGRGLNAFVLIAIISIVIYAIIYKTATPEEKKAILKSMKGGFENVTNIFSVV